VGTNFACGLKATDVRYEFITAVTMKNGVFWDVTPCGYCKNHRVLGGQAKISFSTTPIDPSNAPCRNGAALNERQIFVTIINNIARGKETTRKTET
jgi:hypothetical protein